jgi:uncharacterized protein YkwD
MFLRLAAIGAALLFLSTCGEARPSFAEGAVVRESRSADAARQDLAGWETRILNLHNRERAAVGAPPMVWDATLAAAAVSYALEVGRRGELVHASVPEGENLWMGTRGAYSVEQMVGNWINEKRLFRPGVFPNISTSGRWSDVGHYSQIIWPASTRLGCGMNSASRSDILVCRYAPGGNVRGHRVP